MKYLATLAVGIGWAFAIPLGAQEECTASPKKGGDCWTTEDVIDGHIDHHAQSAMFRMFAAGGEAAEDASAMLCAVKTQKLEGIYLPDHGVPARRAQSEGSGWWLIIPQGKLSECYKQPSSRSPLIAFRKQIKDNRDTVAAALSDAWNGCAIPPSEPRCYIATISKPEPEDTEPEEECHELFQCSLDWSPEKILQVCNSYGLPATGECVKTGEDCGTCVTEPDPQPWCNGVGECIVGLGSPETCNDGSRCVPLPGAEKYDFSCGVCESSDHKDCIQRAWDEYNKDVARCDEEEKEALPECVAKMVKCAASVIGGTAGAAFKDCVKSAGCIVGGPSFRRFECGGRAEAKKSKAIKECSKSP